MFSRFLRRFGPLVASALLHLGVVGGWWLRSETPTAPESEVTAPATLVWIAPEPRRAEEPPAPPAQAEVAPKNEPREVLRKSRERRDRESATSASRLASKQALRLHDASPGTGAHAPGEPSPTAGNTKVARGGDVPAAEHAHLFPSSTFVVPGSPAPEPSHGRTLRPTDLEFTAEARSAEAKARVGERVQTFAEDALGEAMVRGGLPHPYLAQLGNSLKAGLNHAQGGSLGNFGVAGPKEALVMQYRRSAEAFARSGNPGFAPPSPVPTVSEQLKERFGNSPETQAMRALAQAIETREAVESRGPLFAIQVEVEQFRSGAPVRTRLVTSSGNLEFDRFGMAAARDTLKALPVPPEELFHRDVLRSLWQLEGWVKRDSPLPDAIAEFDPGIMGQSVDRLLQSKNVNLEYRAHLLRAF